MSTAEDLINQASNRLVDYSGNAASAANAAISEARQIVDVVKVLLPAWNAAAAAPPGTIDLGSMPSNFTESYADPGSPGSAPDIAQLMRDAFEDADAPTRAMVDSAMLDFVGLYCPDYFTQLATVAAQLNAGANGASPLTDADYARFIAKLESGADTDRRGEQRKIGREPARGHETSLFMTARLDMVEQSANDRLAVGRAEILSHLVDLSVDFRKTCLQLLTGLLDSIRGVFLNYAGIVANLRGWSLQYATAVGDAELKGYEAELQSFEGRRKASLAVLEAAIERAKGQVDVYAAQIAAKSEAKKYEYEALKARMETLRIPYEGELRRNLEQGQIDLDARKTLVDAINRMAAVYGGISESLASGINAIASQSAEE